MTKSTWNHTNAGRDRVLRGHVIFSAVAGLIAAWSLIGWAANIPGMTTFLPARPALSIMTAWGLLIGAGAALASPSHKPWCFILAGLETALGLLIVLAHRFPQIKTGWLPEHAWSSPLTGQLFLITGISALMLSTGRMIAGQIVALLLLLFSLLLGFSHTLPSAKLYQYLSGTGVAIPTVLAFSCLSISHLLACPRSGITSALGADRLAGRSGLKMLIAGVIGLLFCAVSILFIYRSGHLDAESALLVLTWCSVALLVAALWALVVMADKADSAKKQADERFEAERRTLAAAITHDLRSPLQTASLSAEILRRSVTEPRAQASLKKLQASHRRIDRLLRSMLDNLSLAGGRKLAIQRTDINLANLADEVVSENSAILEGRLRRTGNGHGQWDFDALFRVLENLFLNACKYGRPDTPVDCIISALDSQRVRLLVQNHGPQIPENEWGKIFMPFTRGDAASTAAKPGWGVGLAYSRLVISQHGGSIKVLSSKDGMTVFELILPVS